MTSRFYTLTSRTEHAQANRRVAQLFRDREHRRSVVRLQEEAMSALYLPDFDVWLAAHVLPNRYRNAFGVGDPVGRRNLTPTIQLNLALAPGTARPHARFLRDEDGQIWIAHTGTLGGRQTGISREGFHAFLGDARVVTVDGISDKIIMLGTFAEPDHLVQRIARITHAAELFRTALAQGFRR